MKANKIERLKTFCEESTLFLKGWRNRVGAAVYEQEDMIKDRFPAHDDKMVASGQELIKHIQWLSDEIVKFDKELDERAEMVREQQARECQEATEQGYKDVAAITRAGYPSQEQIAEAQRLIDAMPDGDEDA
ncbi:MAG: hypothetical protein Unbinned4336contig1001_24 [Prokaryotic dsDNA virus sp.]|nr:MAG: hypothetical protein Unbinned4336contig1001_24 [Prokaryotic dsDNA virus sp.]|tara:strand:+ start:3366 stop:3761 length:396 start_codon:yes stop_codon:yes gene_type:complete